LLVTNEYIVLPLSLPSLRSKPLQLLAIQRRGGAATSELLDKVQASLLRPRRRSPVISSLRAQFGPFSLFDFPHFGVVGGGVLDAQLHLHSTLLPFNELRIHPNQSRFGRLTHSYPTRTHITLQRRRCESYAKGRINGLTRKPLVAFAPSMSGSPIRRIKDARSLARTMLDPTIVSIFLLPSLINH